MTDHETDAAKPGETRRATWRSIETAPTDGTYVLLLNTQCQVQPFGYWIGAFREGLQGEPWDLSKQWRDYGGHYATPTHWMPLPPAPSAALPPEP